MLLPRLYYNHPLQQGLQLTLDIKTSQYLLHVLRLKKNTRLIIFNGQGGEFIAKLTNTKKRLAIIELLEHQSGLPKPNLHIHVGQALAKGQRMDYALQKSTELGVSAITPLFTDRSNVQLQSTRLDNRLSHWMGVITHACAQSKRCDVPTLNRPEDFTSTSLLKSEGMKFICTLRSNIHIAFNSISTHPSKIILLVGPEGGFTPEEVNHAMNHGFKPLSLGPRTLRTETATVAALSVLQHRWGDLK